MVSKPAKRRGGLKHGYSLAAGTLGALASVVGKVFMYMHVATKFIKTVMDGSGTDPSEVSTRNPPAPAQLGLDGTALPALLPAALQQLQQAKPSSPHWGEWLVPALRAACVAGMLGCNAAMTSCYVLALQSSGSVPATVISTAVNFVVTGVAGRALFREALSLRWWAGAGLTLMGVILVAGWGFEKQEQAARGQGQGRYQLRDRTPQKNKAKGS